MLAGVLHLLAVLSGVLRTGSVVVRCEVCSDAVELSAQMTLGQATNLLHGWVENCGCVRCRDCSLQLPSPYADPNNAATTVGDRPTGGLFEGA